MFVICQREEERHLSSVSRLTTKEENVYKEDPDTKMWMEFVFLFFFISAPEVIWWHATASRRRRFYWSPNLLFCLFFSLLSLRSHTLFIWRRMRVPRSMCDVTHKAFLFFHIEENNVLRILRALRGGNLNARRKKYSRSFQYITHFVGKLSRCFGTKFLFKKKTLCFLWLQ